MYAFSELLSAFNNENEATINKEIHRVLNNLGLDTAIFKRDDEFLTKSATVNFRPNKETC